tara:strand:+ start:387 stop:992 length:606 start_codon:yes stop_codon:yes gene_type:complete
MSVIDFTQEEGYDPNLKTQFVHMTLETNSASCTKCWRKFFKGDTVKIRVVNGISYTKSIYCPRAKKDKEHLNNVDEYREYIVLLYHSQGIKLEDSKIDEMCKEWELHSIRKGYQGAETTTISKSNVESGKVSVSNFNSVIDFKIKQVKDHRAKLIKTFKEDNVSFIFDLQGDESNPSVALSKELAVLDNIIARLEAQKIKD